MLGNGIKRKLGEGEPVVIVSGYNSPDILDQLGPLGFDAAWIDTEHGNFTWGDLGNIARVCDLWDMASLVRVTTNEPSMIMRTLDQGVDGIIVPHVNTREEAQRVVDSAKYAPIGHRGVGGGRRSYGDPQWVEKANDHTIVVAMIEDIQAIDDLPNILKVENIDVFFVARNDLAQSMGLLGQPTHPDVTAAKEKAVAQIVAAGRIAGTAVSDDTVERELDKGARFVMTTWMQWVAVAGSAFLRTVQGSGS